MNRIVEFIMILAVAGLLPVSCMDNRPYYEFTNPVIKGDIPDPSVISYEGRYYAVGTSSEWAPFYPMFVSDDLVNWEQYGHVFDEKPQWTMSSFWAPELFCLDGKVYCYYTARRASDETSYIGVAVADSIKGKFVDYGPVIEHGTEAIDAFVFDDGGQLYVSWKAYGLDDRPIEIVASRLSDDGLSLEGDPFTLLVDEGGVGIEGQCHVRIGDWYYIIYAARGCCGPGSDYEVRVARAGSFEGPYEYCPANPILHGGDGDFMSCGHGTLVAADDGRMFYLCHAYLKGDGFYQGRQPVLHEIECGEDGWLRFKGGDIAAKKQIMPVRGVPQESSEAFIDEFYEERPSVKWSWNYPYSDVTAVNVNGNLMLSGTHAGDDVYGSAFCLRPESSSYFIETELRACGASVAGLTFYGDDDNLAAFGQNDGKLSLNMMKDGVETVLFETQLPDYPIYLKAEVRSGCLAGFLYSTDGSKWTSAVAEPVDLSPIVRWDRVFRPGLITDAQNGTPSKFGYFIMSISSDSGK